MESQFYIPYIIFPNSHLLTINKNGILIVAKYNYHIIIRIETLLILLDQFQTVNELSIYSTEYLRFKHTNYLSVIGDYRLVEFFEVSNTQKGISVSTFCS